MSPVAAIILRDATLAFRAGGGALQAVAFFALAVLVFAFAVGPDLGLITRISAPVLWASALLATQISLDQIYRADREDGSLDVLVETADFLVIVALAKAAAHWLSTSLPLIAAAPLLGLMLNLPADAMGPLLLSLVAGTPALALIGSFAAALAVSLPRANLLISIIVSPLYVPVLIFGMGVAGAEGFGSPQLWANFMLLSATTILAALVAPIAAAAALRANLD